MNVVALTLLVVALFWPSGACAQASTEVQKAVDIMIQLGIAGGRSESISGGGKGKANLTLRSFDARGNIVGDFKISRSKAEGFIESINNASTKVETDEADKVRTCLQSTYASASLTFSFLQSDAIQIKM